MNPLAYRDRMEQVEDAVSDERDLRRLEREIAGDERLDNDERDRVRRRIAFYLSDMHLNLRPAPGLLPLEPA